jgi:signal transduction histidine kinase
VSEALAHRRPPRPHPAARVSEPERLRRQLVRLSFDVHDGPMQNLIAAGFAVRELRSRLADAETPEAAALAAGLDEILEELASAESGIRVLITRLENGHPEIATVDEVVADEVKAFVQRHPIRVEVNAPPGLQPDSQSQALAIRSLLREALTNVGRHAHAETVKVRIQAGPQGILVEIEDDGRGFDPAAVRPEAIGLAGMRQRVELLGGDFQVISRPGGPTVVTAGLERWHG